MKKIKKAGGIALAVVMATACLQIPKLLRADNARIRPSLALPATVPLRFTYVNPFDDHSPATQNGWTMKNPDATYTIAADICPGLPPSALVNQSKSKDPDQSKSAIDQLRAQGQAGLDALIAANKSEVEMHRAGTAGKTDPRWSKISTDIDAVAGQRNAYASGLYWYTDLPAAEEAARASGKPILSLRLLGNLTDEYSCANSRFFRTVLYANAEVSKHLRDHFILHWQSVRPVPVITIDFGDGRTLRRTITGNSIHYVLTPDGKVVDGIPGLYGAKAFLRDLNEAEQEVIDLASRSTADQSADLAL